MREQPQYVMENLDDTAVFFDVCKSLEGKYSFGKAKKRVTTHIAERHRVSRAAALLRGLPSEPLAWEMLLSRVFWLQRVRQSLLSILMSLSPYLNY